MISTWQTRLTTEADDLRQRVDALAAFIGTQEFDALPHDDRFYLQEQLKPMRVYLGILDVRIQRLQAAINAKQAAARE